MVTDRQPHMDWGGHPEDAACAEQADYANLLRDLSHKGRSDELNHKLRTAESVRDLIPVPQMVLVGSSGRNAGKTTLSCCLIARLKESVHVVALKVVRVEGDGHVCHRGNAGCGLCQSLKDCFDLKKETGEYLAKDTARMLAAGAKSAWLLRSRSPYMEEAFRSFLDGIPQNAVIVAESNSLREVVIPGVFLFAAARPALVDTDTKPSAKRVMHLTGRVVLCGEDPPALKVEKQPAGTLSVTLAEPCAEYRDCIPGLEG